LRAKIPYEQRFHSEVGNSRISVEKSMKTLWSF
jgi:hypothetical protein